MRLLLDTHTLLWSLQDSRRLSPTARRYLQQADAVYVSAVCLWEIAIKSQLGKLRADPAALVEAIAASGFLELPVTWRHASALHGLPPLHRDPFDRMLVAQAITEPLRLITHDEALRPYSDLVTMI